MACWSLFWRILFLTMTLGKWKRWNILVFFNNTSFYILLIRLILWYIFTDGFQALCILVLTNGLPEIEMQQILGDIDEQEPLPDLYWSKIRRALKPFIYFAGAIRDIRFIHGAFYEVIWCQNNYNVFEGLDGWLIFESLFFKLRFYISFGYAFYAFLLNKV